MPEPAPAAPLPARAGERHGEAGFELLLQRPRHRYAEPFADMEAAPPAEQHALAATPRVREGAEVAATADTLVGDEDVARAETLWFPATRRPSSFSVTFAAGETPDRSRAGVDSPQAMLRRGPDSGPPEASSPEPTRAAHRQTQLSPDTAAPVGEESQPIVTRENLERRQSAAPRSPNVWGTEGRPAAGENAPSGLGETGNAAVLHTAGADVARRAGAADSAPPAREEAPSSGTVTRISPPEPAAGGSTVQGLRVTVSDEYTGRRVHVHLARAGDDLLLRLRTADSALRRELHEDLPRLAQRIEEAGYRPLPVSETDPGPLEQRFRGKGNEDSHGDPQNRHQRPPTGADERGESGRRRTHQQWMQAFAAAQD